MSDELDLGVAAAARHAALALERDIATHGLEKVGEVKHLQPAFRVALSAVGVPDVQKTERKLTFTTWESHGVKGKLGGVDIIVGADSNYRAFFELKWASTKHELGWTLWDIYKLAAGHIEYGVSAYAIVSAPVSYWDDPTVACASLYCNSTWESHELFNRYEHAWADLLTGGRARPVKVPATISTRLTASVRLGVVPGWELRALRVDASEDEWLDFDGDWPVGHHRGTGSAGAPSTSVDTNSKRSRVEPVFRWLRDHGGTEWPTRFVELADGVAVPLEPGRLEGLTFEEEICVAPSAARVAWMIRNAEGLVPEDGSQWRELQRRVIDHPDRAAVLEAYDTGDLPMIPRGMTLEGNTHADCLIECTNAFVWIEGKRNDWLSPSTTWDSMRDQLARNLEGAWLLASAKQKDFCVIICHEHPLKHHERLLVEGYRSLTWAGGWLHLAREFRECFSLRIGTLTWREIAEEWPEIKLLPELADLT